MSLHLRIIGGTLAAASLITASLLLQHRAADANQQQTNSDTESKQRASQADKSETAEDETADSHYVDLLTPQTMARDAANRNRKAMQKLITVQFKETPLRDAVAHIGVQCGVQTTINVTAIQEEGIAINEPISHIRRQPASARSVLESLLDPLGLTIVFENEFLQVTTEFDAEDKQDLRFYDTTSLSKAGFSAAAIVDLLQRETSGPWLKRDATGGTVNAFPNILALNANEKVHAESARIMEVLRRIALGKGKSGSAPLLLTRQDRNVIAALSKKVTADFQENQLADVAAYLAHRAKIDVILDETALSEEGLTADETITIQFKDISLRSALNLMLEPLGLTYIIERGLLKVTTEICAEEILTTVAFNVRDFAEAGYAAENLTQFIQRGTSGPWRDIHGTGGMVHDRFPGLLVIRQTWKVLEETAALIGNLRNRLRKTTPNGQLPKSDRDPDEPFLTLQYYSVTKLPIEEVRDAIRKFVAPDSWKTSGGNGELAIIESKIFIRQTREVHDKIEDFLRELGEWHGGAWGIATTPGPDGRCFHF